MKRIACITAIALTMAAPGRCVGQEPAVAAAPAEAAVQPEILDLAGQTKVEVKTASGTSRLAPMRRARSDPSSWLGPAPIATTRRLRQALSPMAVGSSWHGLPVNAPRLAAAETSPPVAWSSQSAAASWSWAMGTARRSASMSWARERVVVTRGTS